jgi:hypothetical protein
MLVRDLAVRLLLLVCISGCVSGGVGMIRARGDVALPAVVSLSGTIGFGLASAVENRLSADPDRDVVLDLDLLGGRGDATLKIVDLIAPRARVTAIVRDGHFCLSSCVLIWAAAQSRLAEPDAVFGFHGASCFPPPNLYCRLFGRSALTRMMHEAAQQTSPQLASFLDSRDPPAFTRAGHDAVILSGAEMARLGAAEPIERYWPSAALH